MRSGLSLLSGAAWKAQRRRRKSSAFAFVVPGMPTIVACLRDFGDRRAVPFLMCLDAGGMSSQASETGFAAVIASPPRCEASRAPDDWTGEERGRAETCDACWK